MSEAHQVRRAVSKVRATRDGRFVDVHRVGVLKAGVPWGEQVYNHQVVLQ